MRNTVQLGSGQCLWSFKRKYSFTARNSRCSSYFIGSWKSLSSIIKSKMKQTGCINSLDIRTDLYRPLTWHLEFHMNNDLFYFGLWLNYLEVRDEYVEFLFVRYFMPYRIKLEIERWTGHKILCLNFSVRCNKVGRFLFPLFGQFFQKVWLPHCSALKKRVEGINKVF